MFENTQTRLTFKEYVNLLNYLLKEFPNTADFKVVYSKDDEGNEFFPISNDFNPTIGFFETPDFTDIEMFDEYGIGDDDANAICIN